MYSFGAQSRIRLQNRADHGLVNSKGFSVPAGHPHPEIYRVSPPSPGMPPWDKEEKEKEEDVALHLMNVK